MSVRVWQVHGPEWYSGGEWYTIEARVQESPDDPLEDARYTGLTVQIKCQEPSGYDDGEPVWDRERDLAEFIAKSLNDREKHREVHSDRQ